MSTFTHIKHFFPLAGQSCCLDQLGAPDLLQSIFLYFMFRSVCSLMGFFVSSRHVGFSSPLPFHVSHLISYICILVWLVIVSTDMSLLRLFLFSSYSRIDFLMSNKNFDAESFAAVTFSSVRNSFRLLVFFSRHLLLIPHFSFLGQRKQPDRVVHSIPVCSVV